KGRPGARRRVSGEGASVRVPKTRRTVSVVRGRTARVAHPPQPGETWAIPEPIRSDPAMSETAAPKNVPRGVRPNLPKRPALEEDAWTRIQREQEKMKEREFVRFSVFRVDPAWRRLPAEERQRQKDEFEQTIGEWSRRMMIYAYSLVGTRGDGDLLLWQAT